MVKIFYSEGKLCQLNFGSSLHLVIFAILTLFVLLIWQQDVRPKYTKKSVTRNYRRELAKAPSKIPIWITKIPFSVE